MKKKTFFSSKQLLWNCQKGVNSRLEGDRTLGWVDVLRSLIFPAAIHLWNNIKPAVCSDRKNLFLENVENGDASGENSEQK